MKKYVKFISLIIGLAMLGGIVYASVTTASQRKSPKLPWQGTPSGFYDSAHNVGTNNAPQARFSFDKGSKGTTGVVKDSVTGLMWQSEGKTQGTKNWADTKTYCADLTLGDYTDWRLPNIKELSSIVDFSKKTPSVDATYFNFASNYYWSSTTFPTNTSNAWIVNFNNGLTTNNGKTNNNYVVCTR